MGKQKGGSSSKSSSGNATPPVLPPDVDVSKIAPRRKAPVVKSGNAGSSKAQELAKIAALANPTPTASLFGSWTGKTPLSLLHEHCQKRGWDKPVIDARKLPSSNAFSGIVILKKKDDSVLLKPQEEVAISCETALEARHKAAVYGLFRFANNLGLKMMLPPPMRDYWSQLEKFKAQSPKEKAWWWSPDPFASKAQAPSASRGGAAPGGSSGGDPSRNGNAGKPQNKPPDNENIPHFRLPHDLQDQADVLLRKRMASSAPASGSTTPLVNEDELASVSSQLSRLGFAPGHITSALSWLSAAAGNSNDRFIQDLLLSKDLKDAAISYLQLSLSEAQLPPTFQSQPSANKSITVSKAKDAETLAQTWQAQNIHNRTGFPMENVEQALRSAKGHAEVALACLARDLAGLKRDPTWSSAGLLQSAVDVEESSKTRYPDCDQLWQEEIEALESVYAERFSSESSPEASMYFIDSEQDPSISLYTIREASCLYPSASTQISVPTCAVASNAQPPYIRLALTRKLMERLTHEDAVDLAQSGQGGLLCKLQMSVAGPGAY